MSAPSYRVALSIAMPGPRRSARPPTHSRCNPGIASTLLWPALSFALVGAAYLARQPALPGKRVDGALAWWACLPFAPSGHGRSATIAAALLLNRGLAASVSEAEAQLRLRRPGIRLNAAQRRSLEGMLTRREGE
ncbi:hypothetical protein [Sorangium sp. So ce128]|uniref:hypothetical protein n=1 Tax=Sorangium sp. So ce128 TaxID=3133281 RepID=UPI003F61879D